jgi:hypothetical protein
MRSVLILPFLFLTLLASFGRLSSQIAMGSQYGSKTAQTDTTQRAPGKPKSETLNLISASVGPARLAGNATTLSPEAAESHRSALRTGLVLTAEFTRQSKSGFGIGLRYSGYRSSESSEFTYPVSQTQEETEEISDAVRIHFMGALLSFRISGNKERGILEGRILLGQSFYRNSGSFNGGFEINGTGGSAGAGLGFSKSIDQYVSLFLCAEALFGSLRTYELSTALQSVTMEPEPEKRGSTGHYSLSGGLRIRF